MKRWVKYAVIFVFGGLSALGYNTSLFSKFSVRIAPKQSAISAGVATSSGSIVPDKETAIVGRVIDGDTIELSDKRKVRYIGMDTPEMDDFEETKPGFSNSKAWLWKACFAREAKEENARLVDGKSVRLERDISETDKYGRLLRYVYIDLPEGESRDVFVNDYLVRQGFAKVDTVPPDVAYREQFFISQQEAREQGRGLWRKCLNPTNPDQSDQ